MKITDVRATNLTIPYPGEVRPAWQPGLVLTHHAFTLVRIETDAGLTGYAGSAGHFAATVHGQVRPWLLGEDPFATERLARVYRNAGSGVWCIDTALWDIIGKAAGLPLHRLWGSARTRVRAYASAVETGSPESRRDLALHVRSLGFTAMKLRLHTETVAGDLAILDACMAAVGADMGFMVDANQATNLPGPEDGVRWGYRRALRMARELSDRGVLWLEEPLPRYDFDGLSRLREAGGMKLAGGEKNMRLHEFRELLEHRCYDILQPDPAMSEGVSQLRKVAALAEAHHVEVVPHHGMSGLGLSAALHLACTVHGETWLEVMYEPTTRTIESYQQLGGVLESRIWIDADGFVTAPEAPGLGVVVNEAAVARYAV